MIVEPSCGAVSTRGRNRLSSPACQEFWNGHRTLFPPMVALPLCPSPSQSSIIEYGWGSKSCGVVSTREVILIVPAFSELWRFGGFMNRGWDPIFPVCDGNAPHWWASSSNQSAISQRDWGFLTVQGGVDPRNLGLLPRLMEVLEMWNDLWTGDGTLYPREVELAQHTNHDQSENRSVGLGFPHRAGRYQPGWYPGSSPGRRSCRCVDGFRSRYVTLSCPGDAYFVYESWRMNDQTKITSLYFRL